MATYVLMLEWKGPRHLWLEKNRRYMLPDLYQPWDPIPQWLVEAIEAVAIIAGASKQWMRRTIKAAGRNGLDDLNIDQGVILFDVLFAKALAAKRAVDGIERVAVGRWRPRKQSAAIPSVKARGDQNSGT